MSKTEDYEVIADGWVRGRLRKAGDIVPMTAAQAKYENVRKAGDKPAIKAGSKGK